MRAGTALLLVVAAFVAGILVGRLAARPAPDGRAIRHPAGAEPVATTRGGDPESGGEPLAQPPPRTTRALSEPAPSGDPPDEDQPLRPGADFAEWNGQEFVRWYAIHKGAWDLPEMDETSLAKHGETLVALGRIPRRDVMLFVLRVLEERDRALAPVIEESAAWHAANPDVPRDDPAATAFEERLRAVQQRCWDRLHRELAYSDYRLLVGRGDDDVEVRPPPGGPLPGGDPYLHPVANAREFYRFSPWYRAYRFELGFPERDEDFLAGFHQHVVQPLGRLPEPALMRELQEAYLPCYPRLRDGSDWDGTVRDFFLRLDGILKPLDYERMRHSYEWGKTCRALGIPGPAAGR